jgi:hypothetical protein
MTDLIFQSSPVIHFATNTFVNVPVILQFEDTPLLEVVRELAAGFTTQFSIYHSDGTYLAKLKGSQLYRTKDGEKAGLVLHHPPLKTICELNGKPIIELTRLEAAALKTEAELFAPGGAFLKSSDADLTGYIRRNQGEPLRIGRLLLQGNLFQNRSIGVRVFSDGRVNI